MSSAPDDPRARVDALFAQALEHEGEARVRFLDHATADDPALRAKLERLLELAERPAPQLDPQALAGGALWQALAADLERGDGDRDSASSAPDITGRIVGAWRLLRELGRGGMGTVYLAERVGGGFEQRAALKLIRTGVDSDEFLRRFAQERQILAAFNHPNIARLLDGGRDEEGQPYLVMEYVEGRALDHHCDAELLTIEQRTALFVQIGRAVAHAHRHLVVHRDLKPSNIVVTADGEVKLLDFGIAKVLSQTGAPDEPLTRTAVRLFTPEYATPEQVRGQPATTASDVYQLGLLLYELLTGTRAQELRDGSSSALEQTVCEREPVRPSVQAESAGAAALTARRTTTSALRRKLRGDLDNIVLKALRKAPERRYASASELVDDLERWRQGRPIRARPESVAYRGGKFVRRHPFGVATAAAAVTVLVAYAVTVTLQADTITRERDRARAEAAKAQQVKALVLRLFEGADPQQAGGAQLSARELLDRGWAGIEAELGDQPGVRIELLDTVGEAYRQLGLYDHAQPLFDAAVESAGMLASADAALLPRALRSKGRLRSDQADYAEAERLLGEALTGYRRALGEPHAEVATTLADLGLVRFRKGDLAGAERLHRDALAMRRQLFGDAHPAIADSLNSLGVVLRHQSEYAAAEPLLSEALALRRRLLPANHPLLARSLSDLALARSDLGKYDSAEALYREALKLMTRTHGEQHPRVATIMNNLARLMQVRRDFPAAQMLLRQALAIRRQALGDRHPIVALNLNDLGLALAESGDTDAAQRYYEQALAAYEPEHPWRSTTVFNLGLLAEERGDFATAERHYRETLVRQRADYGDDHERVGTGYNHLGIVLHRQGRLDEAETHMQRALSIYRKRLPDGHPRLASVLLPLGTLLLERDRVAEAASMLHEAWQVRRDGYGDSDARTIEAAQALARAQREGAQIAKQ